MQITYMSSLFNDFLTTSSLIPHIFLAFIVANRETKDYLPS